MRRVYNWVLSWADSPYGTIALAALAFAESCFFPMPADVLLIALCLGRPDRWVRFASICTAFSVLGGLAGYGVGRVFKDAAEAWLIGHGPGLVHGLATSVQKFYVEWDFWIVFIAAFTPIPYKIITITAGIFGLGFPVFVMAMIVGRAGRFFLVAFLLNRYGEPVRQFLERRFGLVGWALVLAAAAILLVSRSIEW